jgi:hypothetical protein
MREQGIPVTRANFIYIYWGGYPHPWTAAHEKKLPPELRLRVFDESEHPRDEHGRWTDAGAADAASGESEKLLLVSEWPNKEKLDKWKKQIADRQKEIADQKQSGSAEDDELYKMAVALDNFQMAKPEDLDSDRAGLNTVYDGDQKLLAATWVSYKRETGVATVELVGAVDNDAKLKILQQVIKRYAGFKKAERIEANEWDDTDYNKESIAIFEQAGFKRDEKASASGLVRLVYGKPELTEAEKAREAAFAAKHEAEILGAGKATAKLAGYDPNKVETSDEVYNFKIGERSGYTAAGIAHLQTGQITLYPKSISSAEAAVSVTVHEVAHQKYQAVLNAKEAEWKRVMADPETIGPNGMRPDGSLPPALAEKYPIYSRFVKHDATRAERIKDDGVTAYSKEYWKEAVKTPRGVSIESADHETIAEMARLEVDKGSTGATKVWRSYYKDVMKTYDELKKAKE